MKKTIALIISVILVVVIFVSCAPATEDVAKTDEETESAVTDIEEYDTSTELDTTDNSGLPIDSNRPKCCKNGCGTRLNKAGRSSYTIRRFKDCYKCPKCQTQYLRDQNNNKWEYCDVQIDSNNPKCCKCGGDIKFWGAWIHSDKHQCTKCGQFYLHYWEGDFWDYAK